MVYKHKILLMDFWSEKNRGDASLQISLVEMVEKYFPDSELSILTEFGTNQYPAAEEELDYTGKKVREVSGGLRPTFYPLDKTYNTRFRPFSVVLSTFYSFILLFLAILSPSILKSTLPSRSKHSLQVIHDSDLIIWKGRNFRGANSLNELYSLFTLLFHPLLCVILKKRMACISASIWELKNPISKVMLKFVFRKVFFLSVREKNSWRNLESLFSPIPQQFYCYPDLSLYKLRAIAKFAPRSIQSNNMKVGLTIMDWRQCGDLKRDEYIKAVACLVKYLVSNYNANIYCIPQVSYAPEKTDELRCSISKELSPSLWGKLTFIERDLSVEQLVSFYQDLDFLVATRMHSAIFSTTTGTPVLAIAYDYGGKWGILVDLGLAPCMLKFDEVSCKRLVERFKWILSNKDKLQASIRTNLEIAYENVESNVSEMAKLYNALGR